MTPLELQNYVLAEAEKFGYKQKKDEASKGNAIFRSNLDDPKDAHYFGFIRPEEPYSSAYSDFSFVIFPQKETSCYFVTFCIGSQGFTNDYELAALPGLRRQFLGMLDHDGKSFCKPSFIDTESVSRDLVGFIDDNCPEFKPIVTNKYEKCLPVARYLDSDIEDDKKVLLGWLAKYAEIRGWATNQGHRKAIEKALNVFNKPAIIKDEVCIKNLIKTRRFVVLQGAPGTGKTFTANKIAEDYNELNVFFEQFHAETTYSDFVYGLEPDLTASSQNGIKFKQKEGILYKAIKRAIEVNKAGERVLLIIDEINRANLSNVLGPVFYLFEEGAGSRAAKIKIGDLEPLTILPENIDVIATMNTADRSLAVVDFALRRRFAWYTLKPHILANKELPTGKIFLTQQFARFDKIFKMYATDDELNLQPGQSYFIVNEDTVDSDRESKFIYELMPLIKEYLIMGYMPKAKEAFSNLFNEVVKKQLFE